MNGEKNANFSILDPHKATNFAEHNLHTYINLWTTIKFGFHHNKNNKKTFKSAVYMVFNY